MKARQRIVRTRRQYNQWVGSQTLEDYALRYTAAKARKSAFRVGNTALGAISFLACEAIGGAITIAYGFPNAAWAIAGVALIMFLIGLPIAFYAARYGVDIDLLTRGAGFGYLGSTITSLIYASFTFLLFSIEASIMSLALQMLFGIPLAVAHLISSLVVIPIAVYGISLISRMQLATQPVWLVLQLLPIAYIAIAQPDTLNAWTDYRGHLGNADGSVNPLLLGMAASMLLSLLPQIGEQVDYLRFLPERTRTNRLGWWTALIANGPGWVFMGGLKLLAGSLLAVLALRHGVTAEHAAEPTQMYLVAFRETLQSPTGALILTGLFVIVCQLKINVTNAYAGSIAWSNFFARLTHNHPGRVVWLVFNVVLALLLMETGIFHVIDSILRVYASFAAGWIGALTADLVINKPLQLSPPHIEFKRAHLFDINPVGVGAMFLSIIMASLAFMGVFGTFAAVLSPFIALITAFVAAPIIAWATRGRFYLARPASDFAQPGAEVRCCICENEFERSDIALCPAYSGPICSLCCTLEARCQDMCKTNSRAADQLRGLLARILPARAAASLNTRGGQFAGLLLLFSIAIGLLLSFIYGQSDGIATAQRDAIASTLWLVFLILLVLSGIVAWLIVLAHENRRTAESESAHQTTMLMEEIEAHKRTDAALQKAKEVAEAANVAKTRYIVGISHEFRTPLNSIFGYAQLLERGAAIPSDNAVRVIRRSSEHLANLVDGLLDISKIESGLLRLTRDKVRLVEFLEQIVDMFRLQAEAKGIQFEYRPPPHLPSFVHTDQKRLRQVLINLLSNAIKYTERGRACLVVRYRSQVAEFEVTDTGVGIPEEDLERIFQPFERGHSAAIRAIPGTGLGLTITKLLTQIMGGDLTVRSTLGTGTTFVVRMLLSEALAANEGANLPQRVSRYSGPRMKVLLADDDPTHLHLMESLLQPLGFTVFTANDGTSCLEMVERHAPDLLMLDVSMPDMTGWQVAQKLRATEAWAALKIVIVSANAHEFMPSGGERAGLHDAFIMKPVDMQALLECIGNVMGLSWIYEQRPGSTGTDRGTPAPLSTQSLHHVDDLYQLGRIGHVRGIEAKLRQIEAEDADSRPFAAHMRGLVSNFDLKQYMSILEGMRQNA